MAAPKFLQQFTDWLTTTGGRGQYPNYLRSQGYPEGGYEGGIDIASPGGTPVYALETGPLEGAGYFCHGGSMFSKTAACASGSPGYGVVTQRVNVPGYGLQDLYYQHIDIDPGLTLCSMGNCYGQIVQKGQRIGTIRQNVGMLELGFNAGGASQGPGGNQVTWGTVWGPAHPGPWVSDPRPMLKALINNYGNPPDYTGDLSGASDNLPLFLTNLWNGIQATITQLLKDVAVFLIAITLIILGIFLLFRNEIASSVKTARSAAIIA